MPATAYKDVSWERMSNAGDRIRERVLRAAAALDAVNIAYAVVGDNAIAAWVSRVDESAVRNTQDVDILLRRDTLEAATQALHAVGFIYRHVAKPFTAMDAVRAQQIGRVAAPRVRWSRPRESDRSATALSPGGSRCRRPDWLVRCGSEPPNAR